MTTSKTMADGGGEEFEKLLYSELAKRLGVVEEEIRKNKSLVDIIHPRDFYILVGSMMFFTLWFSLATGLTVFYALGAIIIVLLAIWTMYAWKVIVKEA
jgi:hypothetical protein